MKKTSEHQDNRSTFEVDTVDEKNFFFRPIQLIYSMAESGDSHNKIILSMILSLVKYFLYLW